MVGQGRGIRRVGEGDAGVEQGGVFQGFAPDHPTGAFHRGGGIVGLEEETDGGVGSQHLPAGEADAVVAEVDGPSVILA